MGCTQDYLDHVSAHIAADPDVLAEARSRLGLVRSAADHFPGSLRTYACGSLAHHTVTTPVGDGDGGIVLNRTNYPSLGPEGKGEEPREIAEQLRARIGDVVRQEYPGARVTTSKRGPLVRFNRPLKGQDPSVDLVVALTRSSGAGLWIPNLESNTWESSDPERHVELLSAGSASLVSNRRRVIRLLKSWNKKFAEPGFFSFHLAVLALDHVEPGYSIPDSLARVFEGASGDFARSRRTPDPAGVSAAMAPVVTFEVAQRRMSNAASALREALAHDEDRSAVAAALAGMFPDEVTPPWAREASQAIGALKVGAATTATVGVLGSARALKDVRAYGRGV